MRRCIIGLAVLAVVVSCQPALAGLELVSKDLGLPNPAPNYDWWYGCSPTSAGMMLAYYDRNGYDGKTYDNLVPGGVAELNTFGDPGALVNSTIASSGHIADFWTGYGNSGDDPLASGRTIPDDFDSLADFMGTSQDQSGGVNINNWDGSTSFWNWNDGSKLTYSQIYGAGNTYWEDSGMYGIYEYVTDVNNYDVLQLYNQYTDNLGLTYGFSFNEYKAEIDADRPVLVHVYNDQTDEGHTMMAYDYGDNNLVYVHDTWDDNDGAGSHSDGKNPGSFTWGGSYGGMTLDSVTVLELTGGDQVIPEPASLVVWLVLGGLGAVVARYRRRRQT